MEVVIPDGRFIPNIVIFTRVTLESMNNFQEEIQRDETDNTRLVVDGVVSPFNPVMAD